MDAQTRFGPILGTLCVSAVAAAAACVGDAADVTMMWALAGGVIGAAAAFFRARHEDEKLTERGVPAKYRRRAGTPHFWAVTWLTASAWVAYVFHAGLYDGQAGHAIDWHQNTWAALGIGTVVLGLVSPMFALPEPPEPQYAAAPGMPVAVPVPPRDPRFAEWEARFAEAGEQKHTQVLEIKAWPIQPGHTEPYGQSIFARLPAGGATLNRLAMRTEEMASDLDLPDGCGIEILSTGSRRQFVAEVATRDAMIEEKDYPLDDLSPTSITDPIPYGWYRNGTIASGDMRQSTTLVIGQKRSGKSNCLKGIMASLARTNDAIILGIDTAKRGALFRPLVDPWVNGMAPRPIVDWVAHDPQEALFLTEFLLEVIKQRSVDYQNLMVQHDDDKLPISHEVPEIIVIIDESAEVMGLDVRDPVLKQVGLNIEEIVRTGGGLAVNFVICALRATVDTIPTGVKKNTNLRIGMRVVDEEEVAFLFGWGRGMNIAEVPYPGCGFERENMDPVRPFRTWLVKPSHLERISVACAARRPNMDPVSLKVPTANYYQDRWKRVLPEIYGQQLAHAVLARGSYEGVGRGGHLAPMPGSLSTSTAPVLSTPLSTSTAAPPVVAPRSPGHAMSTVADELSAAIEAGLAAVEGESERFDEERELEPVGGPPGTVIPLSAAAVHKPAVQPRPALGDDLDPKRRAKERCFDLLHLAGPRGATFNQLLERLQDEGMHVPPGTLRRWLGTEAVDLGYRYWGHPDHHPDKPIGSQER